MNRGRLHRHAWSMAVALIALTNMVVLGGVAHNRSGEPRGQFEFSDRELSPPWRWRHDQEDSGLALRLSWRVPEQHDDREPSAAVTGAWLDDDKMQSLGFAPRPDNTDGPRRPRPLPRDVWLVLEFDGDQYQTSLARARLGHEQAQDALATNPDDSTQIALAENAERRWLSERDDASRLFVIDAGLDRKQLRETYPDRSRYLIAGGRIRPSWPYASGLSPRHSREAAGYVDSLSIPNLHVPARYRATLLPLLDSSSLASELGRYTVRVSYGRRHEPWIVDVQAIQ